MPPAERGGGREGLRRELERKATRKLRARREGDRGVWFGLGMMGVVGWSVAVPTVLGVAAGVWLDRRSQGGVSWTLTGLVVGLAVGCLNAWFWIRREGGLDGLGGPDGLSAGGPGGETMDGTDELGRGGEGDR